MARRRKPDLIGGFFKIAGGMAKSIARAEKQRQQEFKRRYAETLRNERETLRRIKQAEMAERRADRERAKAMRDYEKEQRRMEREQEKAEKLWAKQQAQEQLEAEIEEIESENEEWTTVHQSIGSFATLDEINTTLNKCDFEQQNNDVANGMFDKPYPNNNSAVAQAEEEASTMFDVDNAEKDFLNVQTSYNKMSFTLEEPTENSVREILMDEAKHQIHSLLPWKQKRLRKEYVDVYLQPRYYEMHDEWENLKNEYEQFKSKLYTETETKRAEYEKIKQDKANFIANRSNELQNQWVKEWEEERNTYYNNLRENLNGMISGNKDYVITAVDSIFPNDDLPMEYFVDIAYDESTNKVLVDLDLPEIEDIPQQKIAITSSGKKTIKQKGQTDLRCDYANCVFGLAMYVAYNIFNVSLKIQEIEVSAYTQRIGENSALATDQYIFLVDFPREIFSQIDFQKHTSIEIMNVFKHHYNMTKTYDMKEINLSSAYSKMETFTPADYNDFI